MHGSLDPSPDWLCVVVVLVSEPIIIPESAGGTGGAVENPSHTEFLDSLSSK